MFYEGVGCKDVAEKQAGTSAAIPSCYARIAWSP